MLRWVLRNVATFLLALTLAVGVWAFAVNENDPNQSLTYPEPITLEIVGLDSNLLITNAYSEQLVLTLRAPRSVWKELIDAQDSIRVSLDLSARGVGKHVLTPKIEIGYQPVKILSVLPAEITIELDEFATKTLPLDLSLKGNPSIGYQVGESTYSPHKITVSGAKSLVDQVTSVRAAFDFKDVREDVDEYLALHAYNEEDDEVRGIKFDVDSVHLRVPISQQGGYRDMAVKVLVTGQVANLHRLTNISVLPPVVMVYSSNPDLVNELPGVVETEPLDISGISEDITTRLQLTLPNGVLVVGNQTVLVTASVEAILGSRTIADIPLEIVNLAPSLEAQLSSETVDAIVSAPLPVLETLSATDLHVFVDLAGLGVGTHQLTPFYEILNDDIKVESLLPESIEIIIEKASP